MTKKKAILLTVLAVTATLVSLFLMFRQVPREEWQLRQQMAASARSYLGLSEEEGTHRLIIDLYNAQEVLPREYFLTYEDSWCAAFGTVAAIQAGLGDLVPPECSCEQQILLWQELGRWQESDWYLPQVGDYIYYDWEGKWLRPCTGWSDHVGIVTGVWGPLLQVAEGNRENVSMYRYILWGHPHIRGYGLPDYAGSTK